MAGNRGAFILLLPADDIDDDDVVLLTTSILSLSLSILAGPLLPFPFSTRRIGFKTI